MRKYFAYGSNMNYDQMIRRCQRALFLGPAILHNWGLRERVYADIAHCEGGHVHGVLWGVTPKCVKELDFYEGVKQGLYYQHVVTVIMAGEEHNAFAYVMTKRAVNDREDLSFSPYYKEICRKGALQAGVTVDKLYKRR